MQPKGKGRDLTQKGKPKSYKQGDSPLIKSPLDMTLYAPAIQRMTSLSKDLDMQTEPLITLSKENNNGKDLINNISNFVETMRVNDDNRRRIEPSTSSGLNEVPGFEQARVKAKKALIEAEKYKAIIADPSDPGKVIDKDANFNAFQVGTGISDNNFFHLTCHVDSTLISKIEKGEFVELEKLLLKDNKRKGTRKGILT